MPDFILHHLQLPTTREDPRPTDQEATDEIIRDAMFSGKVADALEHDLYRPIAQVRCSEIHDVFPITNHIDHDWTTNSEVIRVAGGQRSTSVGDIAVDLDAGKAWACQSAGWGIIEDETQVAKLINASKDFLQDGPAPATSPH